jgi:RHS repeat-associated protein
LPSVGYGVPFPEDPNTCLLKLRQLAEGLAQATATRVGVFEAPAQEGQSELLGRLRDNGILPPEIFQLFGEVRRTGNAASHAMAGDHRAALATLKVAWQLGLWFHPTFKDPKYRSGPFIPPRPPKDESADLRAELTALSQALADHQAAHHEKSKFGGTTQFTNTYGYDNAGRLQTVSDSGGVIGTYAYTGNNASMVATLTRQTGSAGALVSTNTWFQFHDRLDVVANTLAGASTSAYDYTVNTLGQRTSVATSGSAFSGITGASWSSWGYNNHGEVTSATHSSDATRNRSFIYDSIGNRKNSRSGSSTAVGYLVTDLVTPSLPSTNKYTKYFSDTDNDGVQDPGETTTLGTPVHDDDGNMTDDGGSGTTGRTFVWDAENRLIQVKDKSTTPKLLATYTYDYRGRRVKKVTTADAVQGPTEIAYLYDGWNVVAEYDLTAGNPSASPTKRHDWGLDLSGSLQGAGGVGGLIRTKISSTSYFPTYDGNGNICELVNASNGTFGARYHYDPFGNTIYESGSAAISNLYRFSSKPVDRESGFYYYGYRYYDAVRGRWLNRDPIKEKGGVNLYVTMHNDAIGAIEILGLFKVMVLPSGTLQVFIEKCEIVLIRGHGDWATLHRFHTPRSSRDPGCRRVGFVGCDSRVCFKIGCVDKVL